MKIAREGCGGEGEWRAVRFHLTSLDGCDQDKKRTLRLWPEEESEDQARGLIFSG